MWRFARQRCVGLLGLVLSFIQASLASPYNVTVVTALFHFKQSKHTWKGYMEWLEEFFESVHPSVRIVVYTSRDLRSLFGDRPNTEFRFGDVWSLGPLPRLKREYERQWEMDPEKERHNPNLYAVWNVKSYCLQAECGRGLSEYCFWVDAGSFRSPFEGNDFFGPEAVAFLDSLQEGCKDCPIFGLVPVLPGAGEKLHTYRPANGPLAIDMIEGGFYGGTETAVDWFFVLFWQWHDWFLDKGFFVGKDQEIMNALLWHHRAQVLVIVTSEAEGGERYCGNYWFQFQQVFRDPRKRPRKCVPGRVRLLTDVFPSLEWDCGGVLSKDRKADDPQLLVVSLLDGQQRPNIEILMRAAIQAKQANPAQRADWVLLVQGGGKGPSWLQAWETERLVRAGWRLCRIGGRFHNISEHADEPRRLRQAAVLFLLQASRYPRVLIISGNLLPVLWSNGKGRGLWAEDDGVWKEMHQKGCRVSAFRAPVEAEEAPSENLCQLLYGGVVSLCRFSSVFDVPTDPRILAITPMSRSKENDVLIRDLHYLIDPFPSPEDYTTWGLDIEGAPNSLAEMRLSGWTADGTPAEGARVSPSLCVLRGVSTLGDEVSESAVVWNAEHILVWMHRAARARRSSGGVAKGAGTVAPALPPASGRLSGLDNIGKEDCRSAEDGTPSAGEGAKENGWSESSFTHSFTDAVAKAPRLSFLDVSSVWMLFIGKNEHMLGEWISGLHQFVFRSSVGCASTEFAHPQKTSMMDYCMGLPEYSQGGLASPFSVWSG
uniref:Uncharacterized protein n=1 Tax=Chromera velia CCMP2878 TaxID=1169474 RepID=A0A0G4FS13_9ALVE|eukprot:Cvel_3639.t1-p1 / transcript=Cvel_3639.t1 / gene=Cvel_3639 / organism=Chromera_velia_CCMP2878 / gene_product=hypothetical protein / transcript_product=hypothetical protein / location=Cvel_scaffold150:12378-15733(-) / protein_length=768 / sequence_SO=supercontig / SO=protein_coding / is_pseudo=false